MPDTVNRRRTVATPRTRGALSGFVLLLLGLWGALIPFIGPYWNYAYTPNSTWHWTAGRGWLEVLPGVVTLIAGLVILLTASRFMATVFAGLAVVAGAWFVVGPLLSPIWSTSYLGAPIGHTTRVSLEQIGIFYGLGGAIIMFASFAFGRFLLTAARDVSYEEVGVDDERRTPVAPVGQEPVHSEPAAAAPVQGQPYASTSPPYDPAAPVRTDNDARVGDGSADTERPSGPRRFLPSRSSRR